MLIDNQLSIKGKLKDSWLNYYEIFFSFIENLNKKLINIF